jgi:transcriptional regulator with XRE-family HTH domain
VAAFAPTVPRLGELLKTWRSRRRLSQLDLAGLAGVSPRHLSFVETGRSKPSREMVLHLAEQLDVPTGYPDVARAIGNLAVLPPPAAVLPMHFRLPDGTELRFFSTMTIFGSPLDVTIAELAIESFFPADEATAALFA